MHTSRLSLRVAVFLSLLIFPLPAAAEPSHGEEASQVAELQPQPEGQSWWVPSYLLDYSLILGGGVGYLVGESVDPRRQALIGPSYDPENPEPIFTDSTVGGTYREEGADERIPTLWVEIGVASSVLFVAAFEGANWALDSGSGLEFHHALMGSLETTALTGATTSLSKVFFGRLRPDFGERALRYHCPGDPQAYGEICDEYRHRPLHEDQERADRLMRDGQKSFISGHSSHGYNLFTYPALVLGGRYVWGREASATSRAVVIPIQVGLISAGTYFAFSRILDERHHLSDVLVGSLVGIGFANLSYWRRFRLDGTPRLRDGSNLEISVAPQRDGALFGLTLSY